MSLLPGRALGASAAGTIEGDEPPSDVRTWCRPLRPATLRPRRSWYAIEASGARDPYDLLGFATATGDLDADGFDDLAIGIAYDRDNNAGSVTVLYGSATGLTDDRARLWSPRTEGVLGESRWEDQFGRSVAVGDVDGDGYSDLVVGVWSPQHRPALHVLRGLAAGVTAEGNQRREALDGGYGPASGYGRAVAVADFDADGFGDIAVGIERATVDGVADAGAVEVIPGGPDGMQVGAAGMWSQATPGVQGSTHG